MNSERAAFVRESLEMTQKKVSKLLNVERSAISHWEHNSRMIPLQKLNKLCNLYQVSMDYLFNISSDNNYIYNDCKSLNKILIGKRIKSFRKENKITQAKLANNFNTSVSVISAYESGKCLILTSFVYDMAIRYNLSMDWICCRK